MDFYNSTTVNQQKLKTIKIIVRPKFKNYFQIHWLKEQTRHTLFSEPCCRQKISFKHKERPPLRLPSFTFSGIFMWCMIWTKSWWSRHPNLCRFQELVCIFWTGLSGQYCQPYTRLKGWNSDVDICRGKQFQVSLRFLGILALLPFTNEAMFIHHGPQAQNITVTILGYHLQFGHIFPGCKGQNEKLMMEGHDPTASPHTHPWRQITK